MQSSGWRAWSDLALFVLVSPGYLMVAAAYQLYERLAHGKPLRPLRDASYRRMIEDSRRGLREK